MNAHSIFYYPYASFRDDQVPLLKAAALYFDKLYILDPLKASWNMIGPMGGMQELLLLEEAGILERVAPEEVLKNYESAITNEILADMKDPQFLSLCQKKGKGRRWTLALAKVPKEIRATHRLLDETMRRFMWETPKKTLKQLEPYEDGGNFGELEGSTRALADVARLSEAYDETRTSGTIYDEYRETMAGVVEYRYADYPLSLGEAIMINHALFGSLLHTGSVPITDDPFHNKILNLKIKRASRIPAIRSLLEDRSQQRQLKKAQLASKALTDLDLAIIPPKISMEELLKYRQDNEDALGHAREELGLLARKIASQPWTEEFANELETQALPQLHRILNDGKKARDSWLKSDRGRLIVKVMGTAACAATAVLTLFAAPATPLVLVTAGLEIAAGAAIPGAEWFLDRRDRRRSLQENGLHYLLRI